MKKFRYRGLLIEREVYFVYAYKNRLNGPVAIARTWRELRKLIDDAMDDYSF